MTDVLLGFAALSLLLAVTPGPDSFLVLRSALRSGSRAGLLTAAGAALGSFVWAGAAALGLAALLAQWNAGYTVVRVLGAAYLVYLGVQSLMYRDELVSDVDTAAATGGLTSWQALRAGLFSAVLNPKIGLFFLAVAPQFLPAGRPVMEMTLILGVVDAVVAMAWLAFIAVCATTLMRWLARPRVNRALERCVGVALTALGVVTLIGG